MKYLNFVMDYRQLVDVYLNLEKTSKRLEKIEIISNLIKKCNKDDLVGVIYLLQGRVFPAHDERKIGMGSRLMIKALSHSLGVSVNEVETLLKSRGDLGIVAEELIKKRKQTTLTHKKIEVKKVLENIAKLSEMEGKGTINRKIGLVSELLTNATPQEARFIVRTVLEELRVGVAEGILRDSIGKTYNVNVRDVEKAFDVLVDYGEVAKRAREGKLEKLGLEIGRPFRAMLSIKVDSIEEGFKAVGRPALLDRKLDGFRVQIHKNNKEIKLFTRRLENVTNQFKEVLAIIEKHVKSKTCILDSEFVGYDPKTGKHMPFQNVSQRIRRKYDIETVAKKLPVEINVFDVLHYNGKDLINETQDKRRRILEKIIKENKNKIVLTEKLITGNEKEAMEFFKESLQSGNEGVMLKNLNGIYQPGRRVAGWVKFKSVLEPLDLVISKCYYGEGKRAGWLTSYTLACRSGNKLLELGKVSTGIKETGESFTYKQMTKLLKPLIQKESGNIVMVNPKIVIEVAYEEIQKSPTYSSGYALRFPKVLRLRSDKPLNEINTIKDVQRIYNSQRGKK